MVRESLEAADFKVSSASGGAEALKVMTQALPDLVILDLKMRQMDGPSVLKEIRAKWGSVSVVVLTGYPESDLMTRALVYSPLTLLSKPFTPDQLVETVKSILGGEGRSNAAR